MKLMNFINNNFFNIWLKRTINTIPLFETIIGITLIFLRIIFNEILEKEYFFKYEAPFYDTGSMMSFLICLEHIYVCYYLIIIIIMVYWFLYICIIDFSGWTTKSKSIGYILRNNLSINLNKAILIITNIIYKNYNNLININNLYLNLTKIINTNINEYKNKNYLNINSNFNYINYSYDLLGRIFINFNNNNINIYKISNLILDLNYIIKNDINYLNELYIRKYFSKFLFYNKPKLFDFFHFGNTIFFLTNKKINTLNLNYLIINLRNNYKEIFMANQFRHSGIFEIIWAIFPTIVIICILIPSLILLYSFEDILSPKLSIKIIGNQWYWTYEYDNWIQYQNKKINYFYSSNNKNSFNLTKLNITNYYNKIITETNSIWKDIYFIQKRFNDFWGEFSISKLEWVIYFKKYNLDNSIIPLKNSFELAEYFTNELDYINNNYNKYFNNINLNEFNKNIYINYSYNSVIIPQEDLIYGTKRLLEVDNRLILPTNITIRFLVTSADVLHAFAMPELGFKVDAVPGRLNQILVFINRPGIFYGQCSELCGANHAFMPIVIQSVLPENYLLYLNNINIKSDLI